MDPLTMAAIGAGIGLLKSEAIDRPREERQRRAAAQVAQWSPWTGMAPGAIKEADPFGSALQGGLTGAMVGQQFGSEKDAAEAAGASQALKPQGYNLGLQQQYQPMQMDQYDPQLMQSPYAYMGKRF